MPLDMKQVLAAGSAASLASAAVLAWRGGRESGDPFGPINGPSQWIWGRGARYRRGFSARHTLVGYAIHHAASLLWGSLYRVLARPDPVAGAVTTAATAAIVDYTLTPKRFTPGYEKRLRPRSLYLVYGAFAAGLLASALLARK